MHRILPINFIGFCTFYHIFHTWFHNTLFLCRVVLFQYCALFLLSPCIFHANFRGRIKYFLLQCYHNNTMVSANFSAECIRNGTFHYFVRWPFLMISECVKLLPHQPYTHTHTHTQKATTTKMYIIPT